MWKPDLTPKKTHMAEIGRHQHQQASTDSSLTRRSRSCRSACKGCCSLAALPRCRTRPSCQLAVPLWERALPQHQGPWRVQQLPACRAPQLQKAGLRRAGQLPGPPLAPPAAQQCKTRLHLRRRLTPTRPSSRGCDRCRRLLPQERSHQQQQRWHSPQRRMAVLRWPWSDTAMVS